MIIASSIAFLLITSLKGDPFTDMKMNASADPVRIEQMRVQFSDTRPVIERYWTWLSGAARGDLQHSGAYGKPVSLVIAERLPKTLRLMGLAYFASILGGILVGTWQGSREGTKRQRASSAVTFTIFALPDFWVAILMQLVFVSWLNWFPSGSLSGTNFHLSRGEQITEFLRYTTLPWLSLTLVDIAVFARYQRTAVREATGQHFIRTARAKGVPEQLVIWKHSLRVSLLPMITIAGLYFPALLIGAIFVEKVFSWPGIGQALLVAVGQRDFFLVAGIVAVGSGMTVLGSILADFTRELVDPRLRT